MGANCCFNARLVSVGVSWHLPQSVLLSPFVGFAASTRTLHRKTFGFARAEVFTGPICQITEGIMVHIIAVSSTVYSQLNAAYSMQHPRLHLVEREYPPLHCLYTASFPFPGFADQTTGWPAAACHSHAPSQLFALVLVTTPSLLVLAFN